MLRFGSAWIGFISSGYQIVSDREEVITGILTVSDSEDQNYPTKKGGVDMSYEFTVNYGEGWKCISVIFPGAPAKKPTAEPFPEGHIIRIAHLGAAILSCDKKSPGVLGPEVWGIRDSRCRRIGGPTPAPTSKKEVAVTFNGNGDITKVSASGSGMRATAADSYPIEIIGLTDLKALLPLGELTIIKSPDGKIVRCAQFDGLRVTSLPSDM